MNPGRELDALIAEKVMGWKIGGYRTMCWVEQDGSETGWWLSEFGSQECEPFSPSEDISAAWEVVEKIKERDRYIFHIDFYMGVWSCGFERVNSDLPEVDDALTAPHAICLAALKAVGA